MSKNYLIVGGTKGIGKVTAQLLIAEGHQVHIVARNAPEWAGDYTFHPCNVTTDELPNLEIALDGISYNPGSINLKPFKSLKTKDFQADFEINALGAAKILQKYYPNLQKAEHPAVVLFSTVAVQTGMAFHASIAMAKGAIEGLTRSLAAEWSPKIRVNAIAPSITQTDLAARLLRNEKQLEAAANRHPLQRIGQAEDAAQLANFLLTEQSTWITGQIFHLDGGMGAIRKI